MEEIKKTGNELKKERKNKMNEQRKIRNKKTKK